MSNGVEEDDDLRCSPMCCLGFMWQTFCDCTRGAILALPGLIKEFILRITLHILIICGAFSFVWLFYHPIEAIVMMASTLLLLGVRGVLVAERAASESRPV